MIDIKYKEIYDKFIGHGSIRLNPEIDQTINVYGHIMYGVVSSKRIKGLEH